MGVAIASLFFGLNIYFILSHWVVVVLSKGKEY